MTTRTISIRELRGNLSVDYIVAGPIVLTSRGIPIATISPVTLSPIPTVDQLAGEIRAAVSRPARKPEAEDLPGRPPARGLSKSEQASGTWRKR